MTRWALLLALAAQALAVEVIDPGLPTPPPTPDGTRTIALTFDDGPVPGATERLLVALAAVGWKATFCVLGQQVAAHPDLARRMVAEGHEVANHSWSHARLTELAPEALEAEITLTQAEVQRITGQVPRWLRPPYLAGSPAVTAAAKAQRLGILGETYNSWDWKRLPPGEVTARMLAGIPHGAVVLAHESFPQSLTEMPDIIARLHAQGYRSVTVTTLVGPPAP